MNLARRSAGDRLRTGVASMTLLIRDAGDRSPPPAGRRRGRRRDLDRCRWSACADAPSETVGDPGRRGPRCAACGPDGVDAYKGVPYEARASRAPPASSRPSRSGPGPGVRDATRLGTPTLQDPTTVYGLNEPAPGEDCLVLNALDPGRRGQGQAGDGLQPRRRLHDRLGRQRGPGRLDAGRASTTWWWWPATIAWACWAICIWASWAGPNTPARATRACPTSCWP